MTTALRVEGLEASVGNLDILKGVNLSVPFGEVHAIMGPNGSGKSTLCHVLAGKSGYQVSGTILVDGRSLTDLGVDERARAGLLQAFQYPVEIPGLDLSVFVEEAAISLGASASDVGGRIAAEARRFGMERFLSRSVNGNLSGGEKKRSEIFQMAVLEPRVMVLDEVDSGLDIDTVKQVAQAVSAMRSDEVAVLMITHYSRILKYAVPDRVHIMIGGRIVDSGGPELADELEAGGYSGVRSRLGLAGATPSRSKPTVSDLFTDTPFDF
jgi:Fe-S cluster assembly ATP-binding protein